MRIRFFTDLIFEMFFEPLTFSRIFFFLSFRPLVVSDASLISLQIFRICSFSFFVVDFLSCMRARILSSLPCASCTADATIPTVAAAWSLLVDFPSAAVDAADAAGAARATASFALWLLCLCFRFHFIRLFSPHSSP